MTNLLTTTIARTGSKPTEINVVAQDDEIHINIRITHEGMILDSYDTEGEPVGTVCMDWEQWTEFLEGR